MRTNFIRVKAFLFYRMCSQQSYSSTRMRRRTKRALADKDVSRHVHLETTTTTIWLNNLHLGYKSAGIRFNTSSAQEVVVAPCQHRALWAEACCTSGHETWRGGRDENARTNNHFLRGPEGQEEHV